MTDLQNCMAVTVYACSGNETNMVWSVAVRYLSTLKRKTKWTAAAVQYHRELCYQSVSISSWRQSHEWWDSSRSGTRHCRLVQSSI